MERLVIAFIVYVGWSVLKNLLKTGMSSQEAAKKTENRPVMNKVRDPFSELRTYPKQENQYYEEKKVKKYIQEDYDQVNKKERVFKNYDKKVESRPVQTNEKEIKNEESMSDFFNFSQNSVLNGIIMAEILGEPKSKKR